MGNLFQKVKSFFNTSQIEVVMIGLENSGKTTLLNQITMGEASITAPTIGLNVKQVKKNGVNLKVWDIGGQVQYRQEWVRYTKGCDVIIFVIDTSNKDVLPISKRELHQLLDDSELNNIPILVVGNKIDQKNHLVEKDIIEGLNLDYINTNSWVVVMISALKGINISEVIDWLVKKSKKINK